MKLKPTQARNKGHMEILTTYWWKHKGRYTRGSLLPQHAPATRSRSKAPRLHQRFQAKKYVAQQNFCSRVLLPHIKLVWYEGASSRGKTVARFCFRSKLPRVYWNLLCESVFQDQAPSCVLKYLLCGSVFQEQAPSCVLALILLWYVLISEYRCISPLLWVFEKPLMFLVCPVEDSRLAQISWGRI